MAPNPLGWQFNTRMVGIDFFGFVVLGLQLGKLKCLRAGDSVSKDGIFTHMSGCWCWLSLAGLLAGCIKGSICVRSLRGLGFFTAWRLLGSWMLTGWLRALNVNVSMQKAEAAPSPMI